jgi:hypothetical protein
MIRLRVVAVIAVLAFAVAALAACGGSSGGEEDPREILDSVSFGGVESASFDAALGVKASGKQAADIDVDVAGQFQAEGTDLPQLDATATVEGTAAGGPIDFEGGVTLLGDHGFVNYKGTVYEIDSNNFGIARSIFLPGAKPKAKEGGPEIAACKQVLAGVRVSDLVEDPRDEGTVDVAGEETTKISGELNVGALADVLGEMVIDLDCRVQLEAISPLPLLELRQIGDELSEAVKRARIDVYVGEDDIVRRLAAEFTAARQGQQIGVDLDLSLADVNQEQTIAPPAGGGKPLQSLFLKLGINPIVFVTSSGGEVVTLLLEKVSADALP